MILWLSVSVSCIRYSKRRKFWPKMRQNAFGGRALPRPAGGAIEGCLFLRGEGRERGEGRKGMGRGGREGEGRLASHTIFRP